MSDGISKRASKQNRLGNWCRYNCIRGLGFGDDLIGIARLVLGSDGQPLEEQMRKIGAKGFRVVQDKNGKSTLERIPFYGRDSSAKIRGKNSKKVRVVSQMQLASLFRNGGK